MSKGKNVRSYGPGLVELLNVKDPKGAVKSDPSATGGTGYIDDIKKIVDMREKYYLMPRMNCTTKDRHDVTVEGLCFYEIYDPIKGVLNCMAGDVDLFIRERAKILLNNAIETHTLDQILKQKAQLQEKMKEEGMREMLRYGTRYTRILIKDIRINKSEYYGNLNLKK